MLVEAHRLSVAASNVECAKCSHPAGTHRVTRVSDENTRCWHPIWSGGPGCRCKQFVDPEEVLV